MDTAEFQVAIVYIKVNSITGCSDRLPSPVPVAVAVPIVVLLVLLLLYLYLRKRKATNPSGGKPPPAAGADRAPNGHASCLKRRLKEGKASRNEGASERPLECTTLQHMHATNETQRIRNEGASGCVYYKNQQVKQRWLEWRFGRLLLARRPPSAVGAWGVYVRDSRHCADAWSLPRISLFYA